MFPKFEILDYYEETKDIIEKFERKEDFTYFTSGSTGTPKKIVHSYELIKQVAEENCRYNNYTKDDYIVNMSLPAVSIGYPVLSVLPAYISGCRLRVKKFNPFDFLDTITDSTHFFILPSVYRVLRRKNAWKNLDLTGKIVSCGADIVPDGIKEDVLSKGAKKFHHLYGATEVPPAISNSEDGKSIGENMSPFIDWYVEEKELFVKWNLQTEYWQSGDLVDENLKITGRKKNILALNCSRIQPESIEAYVLDESDVDRCLLTIKDDKVWLYYEGIEVDSYLKKLVQDWYHDSPVYVKQVPHIETNKMNKLVRTHEYA